MRLVRLLRSIREALPLLVLWACLLEGVVALLSMFIFPPLALGMVFLGLLTLAGAPLIRWALGKLETLALRLLVPPAMRDADHAGDGPTA